MVVRSNWRESPRLLMRKPPLSMIRAVVASVFSSRSWSTSSSRWTSSSISWGRVAMSCVLRSSLADILIEQHARNHVERFKHPFTEMRGGTERRNLHLAVIEKEFHVVDGGDIGQVTLVVLQNVRNFVHIQLKSF